MTQAPNHPPPAQYPSEAERVARLAAELAELGGRLAWARHQLLTLPIATAAQFAPPSQGATPPARGAASAPPPSPAEAAQPPAGPPRSESPAATDGLFSSRVLAWVGGAMTLIGVVMFLVLAASQGWFGIPARLIAGAVLGVALVALGRWSRQRPGGEVGALALVGTGVAALYLDVGTATAAYHYLPGPLGLVCALVVAGVGLAFADRWRSAQLAGFVLLGAGLLMPAVTGGSLPLLVAMVLVAQGAAAPVARRRGWPSTAVIGAAFPLVYGSAVAWITRVPELFDASGSRGTGTAAVVAVFVVGVAAAVVTAGKLSNRVVAWVLVAAPLPALQLAGAHGGRPGVVLAGLVGVALLVVALAPSPTPKTVRYAAGAAGAVAIFQATVLWFDGAALTSVLLGQALVLTITGWLLQRRGPLFGALAYGLAGLLLAVVRDAPLAALTQYPAYPYLNGGGPDHAALITGLCLSVMALLVAIGFAAAATRVGLGRYNVAWVWIPAGVVALYGAAGAVVTTGLLIAPVPLGFVTAHAVVTISWTVVALALLARGISGSALRVAGLVLVAAAVAKLLLFDLVALDGLARVAAFTGAGLVLLAAGARYARSVAQERSQS